MTDLDQRLRAGLAAKAERLPDPSPSQIHHTRKPAWRTPRALGAVAAIAAVVGAVSVAGLFGTTSPPSATTTGSATTSGFSSTAAETLDVSTAQYPFSISDPESMKLIATAPVSSEDLTDEIVGKVREVSGAILADIDAEPPYGATVITAWTDPSGDTPTLKMNFIVNHANGSCFARTEGDLTLVADCSDATNPTVSEWVMTTEGATDWMSFLLWGLPDTVVQVAVSRLPSASVEGIRSIAVLDGTVEVGFQMSGIEQQIHLEAFDAQGVIVLTHELIVPESPTLSGSVKEATEVLQYDTDVTPYEHLLNADDTFLGGGFVLGAPWAIVGRVSQPEGKPAQVCVGVRPIPGEDVCDSSGHLSSQVLPVGDAGIVVFNAPSDSTSVRVAFSDGRVVDVPVVGTEEGFLSIAVVPVERVGMSGTAVALNDEGQALFGTTFEVVNFVIPQG